MLFRSSSAKMLALTICTFLIYFPIHMLMLALMTSRRPSHKRPWLRKRVSHANAMESPARVRYIYIYILFFVSIFFGFQMSTSKFESFLCLCQRLVSFFKKKKKKRWNAIFFFSSFFCVSVLFIVSFFFSDNTGSLVTCWQQLASFREIGNYTQHDGFSFFSLSPLGFFFLFLPFWTTLKTFRVSASSLYREINGLWKEREKSIAVVSWDFCYWGVRGPAVKEIKDCRRSRVRWTFCSFALNSHAANGFERGKKKDALDGCCGRPQNHCRLTRHLTIEQRNSCHFNACFYDYFSFFFL